MQDRTRQILNDMERVREHLLALSDDIWLRIDHNDNDALRADAAFKAAYNERLAGSSREAREISDLVRRFTTVEIDGATPPPQEAESAETGYSLRSTDPTCSGTTLIGSDGSRLTFGTLP